MEASTTQLSDFDVVTERLQPFAPREDTRRRMRILAEEYRGKLSNLDDLLEGERLCCPIHEDNDDVIITGSGRNGTKKFICKKYHDPEFTGRDSASFRFSTYTSFEAFKVYRISSWRC
ncbi:hypothetical protein AKJ42_01970 [candidate division MSBL1 archaeon SCGC-AAA261C02]|uniref:Uncharacterized protein n=1 Tax=candidate division MSBL1 archaeon SCGC-AAA261C02 TaxID=1698272 RepID=A0A133V0V0_9EURY|nr:hypothetical protein AKJ42_01970 [candidate division MSBL1 archaeon SCGC-AAA261C02]